jgi:hypothetical protein
MILVIAGVLAVAMIVLIEAGRRAGVRRLGKLPDGATTSNVVVDTAVLGLMGLLLAFTFSGAASRWEWRRSLVVQEANNIGTAYLRLDLLPREHQPKLRETFRQYVASRLAIYRKLPDIAAAREELERSSAIQDRLWGEVVSAAKETQNPAVISLVVSNVNEMLDITTTRTAAAEAHLPHIVFVMLAATVLAGSLLVGYDTAGNRQRSWIHIATYTILLSVSVYLILELEYPRLGFIRIDRADKLLANELAKMK